MKTAALFVLAALTVSRLWLAGALAVTPLEAYYWLCAHRLDWAFFDGPAGTAWLVQMGSAIPDGGAFALRIAFPLLAAAASLGIFLLGRALSGEAAGIWAAAALNTLPFFNAASVHAGPELAALAFLLLSAWAAVVAMDRGLPWWTLAGGFLAGAIQFHYGAILLLVGFALACTLSSRHRAEWRRPGLYLAAAIPLAALIPAFDWNRAHGWPFLAGGTLQTALTPRWGEIGRALGENFALFSFFAVAALAFSAFFLLRSARLHARPRLALCLGAPFLALWLYDLLHGSPGAFAFLVLAALLAGAAAHVFLETSALRLTGAICLVLVGLFTVSAASFTQADPWARSTHGIAWQAVAASLDELLAHASQPGEEPPLLIAQDPDATAALNYHLARTAHPEVFLRESQDVSNQFGLWPRYDDFVVTDKAADEFFVDEGRTTNPYIGRDALYLTVEELADLPQTITAAFLRISSFATLELPGGRKFRVYLCEDYQTMPL